MERSQLVKVIIAAVLGLVAIVIVALQFVGGGPERGPGQDEPTETAEERRGGGRLAPGTLDDE